RSVQLAIEGRLVDVGCGEGERGYGNIEDVVVDDAHPESIRRDVAYALSDPSHSKDADRQLVELAAADGIADPLEFLGIVDPLAEETPWPEQLQRVAEDVIADGDRVRVWREDDLHAPRAARFYVDVLQPHPAPSHRPELGRLGQERRIHFRISPHHHPLRLGQRAI